MSVAFEHLGDVLLARSHLDAGANHDYEEVVKLVARKGGSREVITKNSVSSRVILATLKKYGCSAQWTTVEEDEGYGTTATCVGVGKAINVLGQRGSGSNSKFSKIEDSLCHHFPVSLHPITSYGYTVSRSCECPAEFSRSHAAAAITQSRA